MYQLHKEMLGLCGLSCLCDPRLQVSRATPGGLSAREGGLNHQIVVGPAGVVPSGAGNSRREPHASAASVISACVTKQPPALPASASRDIVQAAGHVTKLCHRMLVSHAACASAAADVLRRTRRNTRGMNLFCGDHRQSGHGLPVRNGVSGICLLLHATWRRRCLASSAIS
jgi:hypothetical protein